MCQRLPAVHLAVLPTPFVAHVDVSVFFSWLLCVYIALVLLYIVWRQIPSWGNQTASGGGMGGCGKYLLLCSIPWRKGEWRVASQRTEIPCHYGLDRVCHFQLVPLGAGAQSLGAADGIGALEAKNGTD